ncbi:uncharacterized protein L969DRAFT_435526 [Mixia osmundae IAM 14324]|uniref:F-box domain-containing protein n=1 Tax=Mixia osmundae (strain CBS 9802 / IAM 14324 / JCM 22182 / KY 12970) TaxID=764103 RepID=G7DZR4_MIXOS|nr:uncharacterized protein L969DRAFT_435526 [Mixia osmundae IAM 14324]KEI39267.1 hypothetical protein L969DRAFT_435526 [Mixia osmundae IAM 14324]GAA96074.1 hypothetical protein E5Q_02735 [Mixia osmundae IAM 14324]
MHQLAMDSTTCLQSLPLELIHGIIKLSDAQSARELSLASKAIRPLCALRLFKHVAPDSPERLRELHALATVSPQLAQSIGTLNLGTSPWAETGDDEAQDYAKQLLVLMAGERIRALFLRALALPALRTVVDHLTIGQTNKLRVLSLSIRDARSANVAARLISMCFNIQSLELYFIPSTEDKGEAHAEAHSDLSYSIMQAPSLRWLEIYKNDVSQIISSEAGSCLPLFASPRLSWAGELRELHLLPISRSDALAEILRPHAASLQTLTTVGSTWVPRSSPLIEQKLVCPDLRHLEAYGTLDLLVELCDAPNLHSLVISSCTDTLVFWRALKAGAWPKLQHLTIGFKWWLSSFQRLRWDPRKLVPSLLEECAKRGVIVNQSSLQDGSDCQLESFDYSFWQDNEPETVAFLRPDEEPAPAARGEDDSRAADDRVENALEQVIVAPAAA